MNHDTVLTVFVIIAALAFLVQAAVMIGIYLMVRGVVRQIESVRRVVELTVAPVAQRLGEILSSSRQPIERIAANFGEMSDILRRRTGQADLVLSELLDRSRLQVVRLDELISALMDRVDSTAQALQRSVVAPLREVTAVAAGVRAGLEFLRARRAGTRVRQATQDEEMFI